MAKYIDNKTNERESLCLLKSLSQSLELREMFCLSVSVNDRMKGRPQSSIKAFKN